MSGERLEEDATIERGDDGDVTDDDLDAAFPLGTRIALRVLAVIVAIAGLYFLLRVSIPTVGPRQWAPAGHYALPCPVCHSVSANAPTIGVR